MKESIFTVKHRSGDELILFNTLSRSLLSMASEDYARLLSCIEKKQASQDVETLYDMGFLVDDGLDEFKKYLFQYNLAAEDTRFLTITYLTTLRCNFKCCYCYEGKTLRRAKASPAIEAETFERMYRELLFLSHAQAVDFNFFGGEPLVEIAHLFEVMSILERVNREGNVTCSVNVVSNGYLLDAAKIKKCKEIGVNSFQITVDGVEEYHDRYRPLKNGGGTYSRILNNIFLLIENGFEVIVNMNYCSENYAGIIKFLEGMPAGIKDNVYIKFTELKTTALNHYAEKFTGESASICKQLYQTLKSHDFPDPEVHLKDTGPCLANRKNSIIISRNGEVSKCIYGIGNPKLVLGNYFHAPGVLEAAFRHHLNDVVYPEKCKTCNVLPMCMGGCKRVRLENDRTGAPVCEYDKIFCSMVDPVVHFYQGSL